MVEQAVIVNLIAAGFLLWGIATTIVGLYLSYHNNYKQNTKIIKLLERIEKNTERKDKEEEYY